MFYIVAAKTRSHRKNKVYVKTFKVPEGLTGKKELNAFRLKIQLEWKDEVQKKSLGVVVTNNSNILFIDFAKQYTENILVLNNQAYNHYKSCKEHLKTLEPVLGKYKLCQMTQPVIKEFCKWICTRKYKKTTVIVKASVRPIIEERKLKFINIAKQCKLSLTSLKVAMQVGNQVSKETATKICDCLNVAFNKYYDITVIEVPYSLASNNGVKTFVHSVLHEAVIQGLISCNYISNTYVKPVTGTKKEKEILNDNDFNEYMKALNKETDLRKKAAFACFLYLGLRTAEVAGLSWANIDLENQEVSIKQNTIYVVGFGTITKDPKSKNSNRVICMPTDLCDILQQYKVWWDNEKDNHGDLWANTDKLFVQQNGNDMCGSTLSMWLGNWQKKYGLKRVTPHAIRHSVITLLIANNVDVKTVSARAGHSDVQTTLNIYTHYTKEADRQAANKIDTLLKIKND